MRFFSKSKLLIGLTLTGVAVGSLNAETIRLVGPNGETPQSPQPEIIYSVPTQSTSSNSAMYGPTGAQETLWSIASANLPNNSFSVQQTLLAIYRLNPRAFEDQNIHQLIPGSRLRLPSAQQVAANTTEEAQRLMRIHQAKLDRLAGITPPVVSQPVVEPAPVVQPTTPQPVVEQPVVEPAPTPVTAPEVIAKTEPKVKELEQQLELSESELLSLEEKNHQLRLMLSDVQTQVRDLQTELSDEDRVRSEVEKLLAAEKERQLEQQRMQPSLMDNLLSNVWFIIALVLLPSLIVLYLIVRLLINKPEQDNSDAQETMPELSSAPTVAMDAEIPDIDMDDDAMINDDELLMDMDLENDQAAADAQNAEDDPFADLGDDNAFDDMTDENGEDPFAGIGDDGDFELDDMDEGTSDSSANGISVDSSEPAVGLEEMEKALDAFSIDDDKPSDEESSIDLDDLDDEPNEPLEGDIDQSMLDDLLSGFDEEIDDEPAAEPQSQDDFDALFDQAVAKSEPAASILDDEFDLSSGEPVAEIDTSVAEIDDFVVSEQEPETQDELDSLLEQFGSGEQADQAETVDPESELDSLLDEFSPKQQQVEQAPVSDQDELDSLFDEISASEDDVEEAQAQDELDSLFDEVSGQSEQPTAEDPQQELDSLFDEISEPTNAAADVDEIDDLLSQFNEVEDEQSISEEQAQSELNDELDALIEPSSDEEFDIDSLIEQAAEPEPEPEPEPPVDSLGLPENEFGQPQDDDWDLPELEPEQSVADADQEVEVEQGSPELVDETLELEAEQQPQAESAQVEEALTEDSAALEQEFVDDATEGEDEVDATATEDAVEDEAAVEQAESTESAESLIDEAEQAQTEQEPEASVESQTEQQEPAAPTIAELEEAYAEEQAQDVELQQTQGEAEDAEPMVFNDDELPEYGEEQALADADSETEVDELAVSSQTPDEVVLSDNDLGVFDEDTAMEGWLDDEPPADATQQTEPEVVADEETLKAAELNLDALLDEPVATEQLQPQQQPELEEEWPSFELTEEQQQQIEAEIPEEDQNVWAEQAAQPQLAEEDWASQDVDTSQPVEAKSSYMSIDELMGQIEQQEGGPVNVDEEELNLDVGLNEFPDVIGEVEAFDVDQNSEAIGKLDLAKIYIEMNDIEGAHRLLDQAIEMGDATVSGEASEIKATL